MPTNESGRGSRENPVPLGEIARIGDWEVAVVACDDDAWEGLQEHGRFNSPPADGFRDVMITISATYLGETSSDPQRAFRWAVVGSGGNTFDDMGEGRIVRFPTPLRRQGETFSGGSISGNVGASVPVDQIDGATVWLRSRKSDRVFFALQ